MLALVTVLCLGGNVMACPEDTDGDTVCDGIDNCPADANTDQADIDGDAAGDVCDDNDSELNVTRLELKHGSLDSSSDTVSTMNCEPTMLVMMITVFLKSTVRPCPSVRRPSSITCSST